MFRYLFIAAVFILLIPDNLSAQNATDPANEVVDIVWLKDGSRLRGQIISWDRTNGMNFKLSSGASVFIAQSDIIKVIHESPQEYRRGEHLPRPYAFREEGWYHTTSGFLNSSIHGGAGIHHAMGYRFNRLLGIGIGTGIETHDFDWVRNIVPVYAEARGFFLPKKITPYYAVKIGYGIALSDQDAGTTSARGGFHFSPEIGVRFGGRAVNYYLGVEYKIQNASFTNIDWWWGNGTVTEDVSYRRVELRTGLLF